MYLKYGVSAYLVIGSVISMILLSLIKLNVTDNSSFLYLMFAPLVLTLILSITSGVLILYKPIIGFYGAVVSQIMQIPYIGTNTFFYLLGFPISIPVAKTFPEETGSFVFAFKANIYFGPMSEMSINSYDGISFIGWNVAPVLVLAVLFLNKSILLNNVKYNNAN